MSHIDDASKEVVQNAAPENSEPSTPAVTENQETIVENPQQENQQQQQTEAKQTRGERRIRQLVEKLGESKEEPPAQGNYQSQGLPTPPWYQPVVEPNQEITAEQYKADVARTAQEISQLEIKKFQQQEAQKEERRETVRTFKTTVSSIETKYPILNPDAKEYDEALSNKILSLYEDAAGKAPNPKLLQSIVTTLMDLRSQAESKGQAEVTTKLIQQSDETALTPTGNNDSGVVSIDNLRKMKDENPSKTIAYLEKKLGFAD